MRTRFVLAALALIAAGCGGGNTDETTATTTTAAPTTTTATPTTTDAAVPSTDAPTTTTSAPEPVMFTERGPYGVGIATLDLGDRLADVYYPAIPELDAQTEIFDSLSVFPEELQVFIPDELTGEFDTTAYRDALVLSLIHI